MEVLAGDTNMVAEVVKDKESVDVDEKLTIGCLIPYRKKVAADSSLTSPKSIGIQGFTLNMNV